VDDTAIIAISLYENNKALGLAASKRKKRMDSKNPLYFCRYKSWNSRIKSFQQVLIFKPIKFALKGT